MHCFSGDDIVEMFSTKSKKMDTSIYEYWKITDGDIRRDYIESSRVHNKSLREKIQKSENMKIFSIIPPRHGSFAKHTRRICVAHCIEKNFVAVSTEDLIQPTEVLKKGL